MKIQRTFVWVGVAAGAAALSFVLVPRIRDRLHTRAEVNRATTYKFPTAELVALDRDVQRRFAIPPKHSFGLDRVGPMHSMYQPHTWPEKETVKALKAAGLEVAFYVVSARTLRDERGPEDKYPVQGPVHITEARKDPQPRWSTFSAQYGAVKEDYQKQKYFTPPTYKYPSGTPAPTTVPEARIPRPHALITLATRIYDVAAEVAPATPVRLGTELDNGWKVEAAPIRASVQACVNCHKNWDWDRKLNHKIGDTYGVAMYVYRQQKSVPTSKAKTKS